MESMYSQRLNEDSSSAYRILSERRRCVRLAFDSWDSGSISDSISMDSETEDRIRSVIARQSMRTISRKSGHGVSNNERRIKARSELLALQEAVLEAVKPCPRRIYANRSPEVTRPSWITSRRRKARPKSASLSSKVEFYMSMSLENALSPYSVIIFPRTVMNTQTRALFTFST